MSLSRLIPFETIGVLEQGAAPFSELNTADPIYLNERDCSGIRKMTYHVNLIYLLDMVLTQNNLHYLSIEEERFLRKYLNEGGTVTDALNTSFDTGDPFKTLPEIFMQLDHFLGTYVGEHSGSIRQK